MMESLIIRVDASTQMGTGHLMRCLALAQAWKDAGGRVVFITVCQSEELLQRLREENFNIHILAHLQPHAGDWDYAKHILAAYPGAWVVLDGYHFDETYQQQVKKAGYRLLVIDDMAHLKHYYADIVLNQNLHAEQLQYPCEPHTRLLLGTRYVLLRREFLAWKEWRRDIPEVARRVLVTLGGADPENHTLGVIQALQRVDVPRLEATVIIGESNPHTDVLEATTRQSHIPIRLVYNAENMPELMAWADVAISGAGSTVWELAFMGLPMLLAVIADNQAANGELLRHKGGAVILDPVRAWTPTKISQILWHLLHNKELRKTMGRVAGTVVDGLGASRVVEQAAPNRTPLLQ